MSDREAALAHAEQLRRIAEEVHAHGQAMMAEQIRVLASARKMSWWQRLCWFVRGR